MAAKSWTGTSGAPWNVGADWDAGAAPLATDDAAVTGSSAGAPLAITGPGTAAAVTVLGNAALSGAFTFASLSVGAASGAGSLLLTGGSVQAGAATLLDGPFEVRGAGTQAVVTGTLTLGGARASTLPDGQDVLAVTGGATVRAGSMLLTGGSYEVNSIQVDAASSLEVGTAGGVASGVLAVDPGRSLAGAGYLQASAGILNGGTITAQGGTLRISSPVTGTGTLQIGAGATLALAAFAQPSTVPVRFAGPNGTLQIGAFAGNLSETGLISGFAPGDTIAYTPYGGALQSATYAQTGPGLGTLSFNGANGVLGTLRLAGDFSADSFVVTPDASGASDVVVVARASGAAASPGSATPDSYVWTASGSGDWGVAANWADLTVGSGPAAIAPGANDFVTVRTTSGSTVVSGAGNAASLTVAGSGTAVLNGTYATGSLTIGPGADGGSLSLAAGTVLQAGMGTIAGSGLQATGRGTSLNLLGSLMLAAPLALTAGASGQVSQATLLPGAVLSTDATSRFELGSANTGGTGQIQIDAGRTLTGVGLLSAAAGVLDNGAINAVGGTLTIDSAISGSGTMGITPGATLALTSLGAASTAGVAFSGTGGTLQVTSYNGAVSEAGVITGFARGDTIAIQGVTGPVAATYQPGVGNYGRLVLSSGGTPVGVLNLQGDFSGYVFSAMPTVDGTARVTLRPSIAIGSGLTDLPGAAGAVTLAFSAPDATVRLHGLQGGTEVTGMQLGDSVDLVGITGATLAGNTVTAAGGTLTLAAAPDGYVYKLYGDSNGGTAVLVDPVAAPAGAIQFTALNGASGVAGGDEYTGPVDYLQRQYVWSGGGGVAVASTVPNVFLKGGPAGDALKAAWGNNVLDGGAGSNFLIGGTGADGGHDTFFVDAQGGGVTWSTLVNFHPGDQATIWGFGPTSTRPLTASDGATGSTGATIHSEIAGPGTGVTASITFAGVDQATAANFIYTTGTLSGNLNYLLIQYR